jgi:hypothetical protein
VIVIPSARHRTNSPRMDGPQPPPGPANHRWARVDRIVAHG